MSQAAPIDLPWASLAMAACLFSRRPYMIHKCSDCLSSPCPYLFPIHDSIKAITFDERTSVISEITIYHFTRWCETIDP